jgi:calcineurin-like phosphoesterase family protein
LPEPSAELPVLVVGDVHGDLERLFQALRPYPPEEWHTIFLGDLVDGGDFGVGALRYARDRPNSTVILGNHEVLMLWVLWERRLMSLWASIGGQQHDLQELAKDEPLQDWLRGRPLLVMLPDGTLVQHSDTDFYGRLGADVDAVNVEAARLLRDHQYDVLWDVLSPGRVFRTGRSRLDRWLQQMGARRIVHGHVPHGQNRPDAYHEGLAIAYDGGLSRYYGSRYRRRAPLGASVAPLPQ